MNGAQLAGTTGVCWEFAVQRARHTRKENIFFFPLPSRLPLIASQIPMNAQSKINASHHLPVLETVAFGNWYVQATFCRLVRKKSS